MPTYKLLVFLDSSLQPVALHAAALRLAQQCPCHCCSCSKLSVLRLSGSATPQALKVGALQQQMQGCCRAAGSCSRIATSLVADSIRCATPQTAARLREMPGRGRLHTAVVTAVPHSQLCDWQILMLLQQQSVCAGLSAGAGLHRPYASAGATGSEAACQCACQSHRQLLCRAALGFHAFDVIKHIQFAAMFSSMLQQ